MADASMSPASSSDLYPPSDHDVPMTAPAPSGEASAANRTDALFDDFSNADSQHARKNEESGDDLFGDRISISNHPLHPKRKRTSDGEGSERPVNGEVFEENGTTIPEHAPDPKRQRHDGLVQGLRTTLYPRTERLHGGLTVPIWRRIFCYVPPVFLGRLLRVDRTFHGLLNTPPLSPKDPAQDAGGPSQISAESIWISSRKRFAPGLPRTIPGQSELDMWRLLRGNVCQLCGEKKPLLTISESLDPWRSGPGSECVRVVWPFGVRSCGRCLQANSEQEVTLLFSSTFPAFLLPALPFAFITQSQNYVASSVLRNGPHPTDVRLIKHYFKFHVDELKREFEAVKDLGPGSAEEWIKGLEAKGKERIQDASRWEQWESKGGLKKVNQRPNIKPVPVASTRQASTTTTPGTEVPNFSPLIPSGSSTATLPSPVIALSIASQPQSSETSFTPRPAINPPPGGLPQRPQVPVHYARPERNIRDVNEAKAARRSEIERRCLALTPPIEPNILSHMESFQAALQISTTLTEHAWDVLKPRLLAQREAGEARENERQEQTRVTQARSEERKQQEAQFKETKEAMDREWDLIQMPIRDKLAKYADEIIQGNWSNGNDITKELCSKFAVDVLLHARQRFYEDLVREDSAILAAGRSIRQDAPNEPPTRKLILENMKWLFDNKIKSFTEHFQKELFLCNGCEGNFKFYGFEAVIQHYAAKHTSSLSLGSIVVHWRAEWPETPPFHPNPSAAKTAFYAVPQPVGVAGPVPFNRGLQSTAPYGDYAQVYKPITPVPLVYDGSYASSPYPPPFQSPFQPPYQSLPQPDGNSIPTVVAFPGHAEYQAQSPAFHPVGAYPSPVPAHHGPASGFLPPRPQNVPVSQLPHGFAPPSFPPPMAAPMADLYQTQMNEMAKHARDVWFGTSGIKDIPQSVRIYVVIQHVVNRFEQKYTNEPNLSMFIDGLDHNALMRPVRSLNGLACKTCVTAATGELHPNSQHPTNDRKLYTLPHLLTHFKSVHVERARTTVDLQTGMEAARLDWKRDMIELPDTPMIADLIRAPGMDDSKLKLIAWVFPGVFPDPLPSIGSVKSSGPVPQYRSDHDRPGKSRKRGFGTDPAPSAYYTGPSSKEDVPQQRPYPRLDAPSHSTSQTPEPVREDEYDPHRPAYLGKCVASHAGGHGSRKTHGQQPLKVEDRVHTASGDSSAYSREHSPSRIGSRVTTAYGSDHSGQKESTLLHSVPQVNPIPSRISGYIQPKAKADQVEESVLNTPASGRSLNASPKAEVAAADKFLREFNSDLPSIKYGREPTRLLRDLSSRMNPNPNQESSTRSHSRHEPQNAIRSRGDDAVHEQRIYQEPLENTRYSHAPPGNHQFEDDMLRSSSRVHYVYTDNTAAMNRSHIHPVHDLRRRYQPDTEGRDPRDSVRDSTRVEDKWPNGVLPRDPSHSPRSNRQELQEYPLRAPYDPYREQSYQIRLPPEPRYSDARPPGHVSYSYPRSADDHGLERNYVDRGPERHVEYIPVSDGHFNHPAGRYVVTHPTENRVRVDRGYPSEQIYERDGQYFYTEPRQFETHTARGAGAEYIQYRLA